MVRLSTVLVKKATLRCLRKAIIGAACRREVEVRKLVDVSEVYQVAVGPAPNLDADLIRNVAATIDKSPYDARLLLAGDIPRIVAHYQSMQVAQSAARKLQELGLKAIACRGSDLRQAQQGFKARRIEFKEKEVLFIDSAGREKSTGPDDVFLVLEGRRDISVTVETTKPKVKFSLTRTLLAGGIPIWHKVNERTTLESIQTEFFARLCNQESATPTVEVLQHHLDYSFLGAQIATSSTTNFGKVVLRLREVFPKAIFDERLLKPHPSRVWESVDTNCHLIWLFHLASGGPHLPR
jgi:hypothetical protein